MCEIGQVPIWSSDLKLLPNIEQWHTIYWKGVIGMMIWSPQTVQKRQRKCFIYFPRFLPSDLHWGTQHQSLESLMGLSIFTMNDVVFTFTSGVATQTGSNDACSLRQITWSINKKMEFLPEWKWLENIVLLEYILKVEPCTLRLWNGLPASTKSSPSLNIFKTRLNSGTKASPKYFHIGDRKENIIHFQMRNDASNLNLHLQQHHLSDRPSCPHCNDPSHYFMHCPLYNIHRQQLVDSFNELNREFTIQTILYGSVKLFRAVHSFIKRSKRFDDNIVI